MKIEEVEKHYRENYKHLVNRAINRVPDNSRALAEEVVQETYYRVYKYFGTYKPKDNNFEAWITRIFMNCISDCRTQEAERGVVRDTKEEEEVVFNDKLSTDDILYIQQSIDTYEPVDKKTINLFFFEGLTIREISTCSGRSVDVIKKLTSKFGREMRAQN